MTSCTFMSKNMQQKNISTNSIFFNENTCSYSLFLIEQYRYWEIMRYRYDNF